MRRVSSPVPFPAALPHPYSAMALVVAAVIILMKSPSSCLAHWQPSFDPCYPCRVVSIAVSVLRMK